MKDLIIMYPTLIRAREDYKRFCRTYDYLIDKKKLDKVLLKGGTIIEFRAETEGQKVLKGTTADVVYIDEFRLEDFAK